METMANPMKSYNLINSITREHILQVVRINKLHYKRAYATSGQNYFPPSIKVTVDHNLIKE